MRGFAESQLSTIEGNLQRAEDALRQFREQKGHVFLTEEARSHLTRVTNLESKYDKAHLARLSAIQQIRLLENNETAFDFEQDPSLFERIFTVDQTQILFKQNFALIELLREREALLIDRTSQHPLITMLNAKIHNLRQEMVGELAAKIEYYRDQEDLLQRQLAQQRAEHQRFPLAAIQLSRPGARGRGECRVLRQAAGQVPGNDDGQCPRD